MVYHGVESSNDNMKVKRMEFPSLSTSRSFRFPPCIGKPPDRLRISLLRDSLYLNNVFVRLQEHCIAATQTILLLYINRCLTVTVEGEISLFQTVDEIRTLTLNVTAPTPPALESWLCYVLS